ncbi:MAG: NADH-quinone oxidoreductase subunit C [Verrucomicrobiales bacterium]
MTAQDAAKTLRERFGDAVRADAEFRGETTVTISREAIPKIMAFCRGELDFDYLVDASSVDNFGEDPRYEIVYELYSYAHRTHLRIKAAVLEDEDVASVSAIWPTANWHEREIYDMMGIRFKDHPDLRRILMWEGYPFYPLRKDFPLAGKPSEMPDIAFTDKAPLAGGPFVTSAGAKDTISGEPRSRSAE